MSGPIDLYFASEGSQDARALVECFAPNATVHDEGRTFEGLDAIRAWRAQSHARYHHTVEPLSSIRKGDKTVVTAKVSGNFPGSPANLEFAFTLQDNLISSLEIG